MESHQGVEPFWAQLHLSPREGEGAAHALRLRKGSSAEVQGLNLKLQELSSNYAGAYGPAVHLSLDWRGGADDLWIFAQRPALDKRLGYAPFELVLEKLEPRQIHQLEISQRRERPRMILSYSLLGLGLLLSLYAMRINLRGPDGR